MTEDKIVIITYSSYVQVWMPFNLETFLYIELHQDEIREFNILSREHFKNEVV